ncbi:YcaO-like family protein [Virgibacillus dokdonensis]|uniref:YcaO-like family protein n=1 Tax=Virgibacillus dokdonensis TaxID=302167 RepID=UPI00098B342D|nr:YcaO-like family protein [Virgibacillus dokdonensis]
MNEMKIDALAQPLGGLLTGAYELPNTPGEPQYIMFGCDSGNLSNIARLKNNNYGMPMELPGAGGDVDREEARLKAYAEALERYCNAVYTEDQFIFATANELGEEALNLDTVPICSEQELASPYCPVRKPDKNEKIRWVKGMSLTQERPIWIPAIMAYLFIPFKSRAEEFYLPISTGTATHTTYNQAIINGINEVIERDAISLTWLHKISWRRIQVDYNKLPKWAQKFYVQNEKIDYLKTYYLDATTDIGVPTIYSIQFSPYNDKISTIVMCTTDLDPLKAYTKITRETASVKYALQNRFPKTSNIDHFRDVFDGALYMGKPDKMKEFDFLTSSREEINLLDMKNLSKESSAMELSFLINKLKEKNLEVFVVDLTTDEALRCGFRTVKVIIPGLQPLSFVHRARYLGHNRVYDAAINLGLGDRKESSINSNPSPFA